jgi:hypothetical protein
MTYAGLFVATCAVLITLAFWRMFGPSEPPRPSQRTSGEVSFTWKCRAGHRFHVEGQIGPRHCIQCGEPADIVDTMTCPTHGDFEVALQFRERHGEPGYEAWVRLAGEGEFVRVGDGLRCPKCSRPLKRFPRDPLATRRDGR